MSLTGRRVLVTGGTGFIGSALARRLLKDGAKVHLLVRPTSSPERLGPAWDRATRHVGDLGDERSLAEAVRRARPELVFHLAKDREGSSFEREAAATRRLASVLRTQAPDLERWVRTAHSGPSRDADAALAGELAGSGLPVVTLELFLVYGPGQDAHDFPASFLSDPAPGRLSSAVKDFVFIDDVVAAYRLAAEAPGLEGSTIPIGTGQARSEAEAAGLILRMKGLSSASAAAAAAAGGHPAEPALALKLLGWRPRVLLEQGLARMSGAPAKRPDGGEERRHMAPWLGESGTRSKPRASSGGRAPWSLIAGAARHFQAGDAAAAERDADAFIARMPGAASGPVMKALLAAHLGDRVAAERWLEAAGPRGPEGWVLAVRGMLRARWQDFDGALRDLQASRRSEGSAWAVATRAEVYNRVGLYRQALTELARMRRVMPGSPEPDSRAAAIHLEQAQYEEALACMDRAVKRAPGDAALRRQRSRVHFVEGDLGSARRDIEEAWKLAPGDLDVRQERLRLCLLLDDHEASEAQLREAWPAGIGEFWLGYLRCRQKRFDESRDLFAAAEAAAGDGPQAHRCAFYRFVVRVLAQAPPPAPIEGKELVIMGLGYRHPYQLSVEAVWALSACEEFYSNLSDTTVADFLGLFGVPMRTIVFRRTDGQSTACARIAMKAMRSVTRGAVTTRGQPNYYGRLAYRLVQDCAARGIACRIIPTVSISDFLPSLVGRAEGGLLGMQIRDTNDLDRLDARLPMVVYNFASGSQRLTQGRRLQAMWAADRPCWLLAGSGQLEYEPLETTVGALDRALATADPAVTLMLPARRPSPDDAAS